MFARNGIAFPSGAGDPALNTGVGFDEDGHSPERAVGCARRSSIFFGGAAESAFSVDVKESVVGTVIARNTVEIPLGDLHDGVATLGVEALQTGDIDLHEIAVHACLLWGGFGGGLGSTRDSRDKARK